MALLVSILVLLEVPLRPDRRRTPAGKDRHVSILVLLEVPLRPAVLRAAGVYTHQGFNPCFVGSSS